jgi:hypothetical protein
MSKSRHHTLLILAFLIIGSASTLVNSPGTQAQTVTGSGTAGRLPKFTGTTTVGNSIVTESSGKIGINTTAPQRELHLVGIMRVDRTTNGNAFMLHRTGLKTFFFGVNASAANNGEFFISDLGSATTGTGIRRMTINNTGNVGIGIDIPASKLSVAGTVQSTTGGFKFPDGTTQASAGLSTVTHNSTLTGNGKSSSPLGVSVPLVLSGSVFNGVIQATDTGSGIGISASSNSGYGGYFGSGALYGVYSTGSIGGVYGLSPSGDGVTGESDGTFAGVFGINTNGGKAGEFSGDVTVSGTLSKSAGSFKIDHPLDPEHKYLSHSFVESPDMMNIYNGNVMLDGSGEAVVQMPDWFEALNQEFRYQLTSIGAPGPNLYIAEKILDNHFRIAGGTPGMEVSWMVTGIRHDAYANAHRITIEEEKPDKEKGSYLHPELFQQAEEKGVEWATRPQTMQRMKLDRLRRGVAQPETAAPQQ